MLHGEKHVEKKGYDRCRELRRRSGSTEVDVDFFLRWFSWKEDCMFLSDSADGWVDRSGSGWENGGNDTRNGTEGIKKEPLITCNIIPRIQNIAAGLEVKRSRKVTVRV